MQHFVLEFSSLNGILDDSYALDATGSGFAVAAVGFNTRVQGIRYQTGDDQIDGPGDITIDGLPDGIPDTDSQLWDNLVTPNFGADTTAGGYKIQISSTTTAPVVVAAPPGGFGTLTDTDFTSFTNGAQTHTMTFDEVGIIDLEAVLLDLANAPADYLSSNTQLTGHVRDVGRFYPATFELSAGAILSRIQAASTPTMMCIDPISAFTYMGEEFQVSALLEAQNALGVRTRNYVGGAGATDFAKLEAANLPEGSFFIFEELVGVDNDLSTRRAFGTSDPDISWPGAAIAEPNLGIGLLGGNLVFNRQADGSEDGPYITLSIGLTTSDSDGAVLELDIDLDEIGPLADDVALVATETFRYGRLMIDNAFGPETEDLAIPFRIEYWNGSDWATNTLDSCTILTYDASEDDATLRSAFYVDDSWEGVLDGDSDGQDDGETVIENAAVIADSNIIISISGGLTGESSGVDANLDNVDDDRPLITSAPGEGFEGSVLVEFNLFDPDLPYPLDFLSYDWRSTVEIDVLDEIEDGNYVNNPRGQINFGSYRGHDRVINWQEIYIGPTP